MGNEVTPSNINFCLPRLHTTLRYPCFPRRYTIVMEYRIQINYPSIPQVVLHTFSWCFLNITKLKSLEVWQWEEQSVIWAIAPCSFSPNLHMASNLLLYYLQLHPVALYVYNTEAALLHLRSVHLKTLLCVLNLQAGCRVYKILSLFKEGRDTQQLMLSLYFQLQWQFSIMYFFRHTNWSILLESQWDF